jgi:hypothetical protein
MNKVRPGPLLSVKSEDRMILPSSRQPG